MITLPTSTEKIIRVVLNSMIVLSMLVCVAISSFAQGVSLYVGTEFLFTYPPFIQEADNWQLRISSLRPVTVRFSDGIIADYTVAVVPDSPTVVKNLWQQVRAVERSEVPLRRSVRITSPTPITVLAVHDSGYVVPLIPIEQWGTSYIHATRQLRTRSGDGLLIVAADDSTDVSIQLRGTDAGFGNTAQTERGRNIGERWSITLQQGESYLLVADSLRRDTEFAGTSVVANKPVGVLSFYKSSDDNLGALIAHAFPLSTLGGRRFVYASQKPEQLLRFIAGADNTTLRLRAFRPGGNTAPVTQVLTLQQGESHSLTTQEKTLYLWEADKQALLLHSSAGEQPADFSPIAPIEQFARESIIQLPSDSAATLFIVAEGDPSNRIRHEQILRGLTLNGESLSLRYPDILGNRIPETALYFLNISLPNTVRSIRLRSILPHSSTLALKLERGQSFFQLPTIVNQNIDTLSPRFTKKDSCSIYTYFVADTINLSSEGNLPPQQDRGIIAVQLDIAQNIEFRQLPNLVQPRNQITFTAAPIHRMLDGFAVVRITDAAGNIIGDTLRYIAPELQVSTPRMDFGITRLGNTRTLPLTVTNRSSKAILLRKIISNSSSFRILAPPISDTTLSAGASLNIVVEYAPTNEHKNNLPEEAILQAITPCDTLILTTLAGKGGMPRMVVQHWNSGDVFVDSTRCLAGGLAITNIGTDTLVISEITGVVLPFSLSRPTIPSLPIWVAPEQTINLGQICFTPLEIGKKNIVVRFISNAEQAVTTSEWQGVGVSVGFAPEPLSVGTQRLLVPRDTVLRLFNGGSSAVIINTAQLLRNKDFSIIEYIAPNGDRLPFPFAVRPTLNPNQTASLLIRFQPTTTGSLTDSLLVRTNGGGLFTAALTGFGTLPIALAADIDFGTRTFFAGQVVDTTLSISNISENERLIIKDIRFAQPALSPDTSSESTFVLSRPNLPYILRPNRPHGPERIDIPLRLRLPNGSSSATIIVISNAVSGPDTIAVNDTLAVQIRGKGIPIVQPIVCNRPELAFSTLICNDTIVKITFANSNPYPIRYDSIFIETEETDVFRLLSSAQAGILAPNDTIELMVQFTPQQRQRYTAQVRIMADTLSAQATLNAAGVVQPLWLLSPQPKERFMPGNTVRLPFRAETSQMINVSELIVEFVYPSEALIMNQLSLRSEQDNIQITLVENTPGRFVVRCSGEIKNGDIFSVQATIYTVPQRIIPLSLRILSAPTCILPYVEPGGIAMSEYCLQSSRQLRFGNTLFSLNAPSPNPVTDNGIEIRYSLGFDVHTVLQVCTVEGNVVAVPVNDMKKAGEHTLRLDTSNLPSGAYIIRCWAGPFADIQWLFVVK